MADAPETSRRCRTRTAQHTGRSVSGTSNRCIAAPSNQNVAAPSNQNVAAPSNQSEAAPSNQNVAAPSNQSVAAPSNQSEAAPSGKKGKRKRKHEADTSSQREAVASGQNPAEPSDGQAEGARMPYLPSYIQEDTLCVVCGDKSTGYHYRALTCEGCKGFFRRIIQKYGQETPPDLECSRDDNCRITVDTRNSCQYCRYKKCIAERMDANSVLNEAARKAKKDLIRSNKLLRQEKNDLNKIESHYKHHFLDSFWYPKDLSNDGQINLSSRPDVALPDTAAMLAYIFVLNFPGVSEIHKHDLFMLVRYRLIDVLALQLSQIFNLEEQSLNFINAQINERDALQNEALKNIYNYAKYFAKYYAQDKIIIGLLCAVTFLNSDVPDLIEPKMVQAAQNHIIAIFTKYIRGKEQKQEIPKGTIAKLIGGLNNFEHIRDDMGKLIWKITGMKEDDSFVRLLMLNGNPDDHMESVEYEDKNSLNESVASVLLNNSTSPNTIISPSTSISPNTSTTPLGTTPLYTITPSSASTPVSTFPTPSTSDVSSTCNTPSSPDMATDEDKYVFWPVKQEADTDIHQHQQNVGYFGNIPYLPLALAPTPTHYLQNQPRPGIILPEHPSSPPNFSGRSGYQKPNNYGQYASPLSSTSSASGHSDNVWSRTSDSSLNTVSETIIDSTNHAQYGLDLSLRGANEACYRSDDEAASPYRIPLGYCSSNPLYTTKQPLSPVDMGVPKKLHPQNPAPHFQVNVLAAPGYELLVKNVEDLKKKVSYLSSELEKKNGGNFVNQEGGMQRSDPSDGNFESSMHGFTNTRPSLSESASSPHFNLLDDPEVTHALSTRQLSYVNKIPHHFQHRLSQISLQNSSDQSGNLFTPSPDMPESKNQPQCTPLPSFRPQTDQTKAQPNLQALYENRFAYAPFKPGTSSLQGDQNNHTCNNYYTHAPYGHAIIQASRPDTSNNYQDLIYNPASTYSYPGVTYELTTQQTYTTAGESTPADLSAMAYRSQAKKNTKYSDEPKTSSLPLKKQQRIIGIKKKWLQDHLSETE